MVKTIFKLSPWMLLLCFSTLNLWMLSAQELPQVPPVESYPGQRQHQEPPVGYFCSNEAKDKAHKCECKRMTHPTPEDPSCCETAIVEDMKCQVWCHPQHCLCPVKCEVPSREK